MPTRLETLLELALRTSTANVDPFKDDLKWVQSPVICDFLCYLILSYLILSYLSCSLADRWGTTVDFKTSFFHSSLFSVFCSIFRSRPVHSLMLSSHLCYSLLWLKAGQFSLFRCQHTICCIISEEFVSSYKTFTCLTAMNIVIYFVGSAWSIILIKNVSAHVLWVLVDHLNFTLSLTASLP